MFGLHVLIDLVLAGAIHYLVQPERLHRAPNNESPLINKIKPRNTGIIDQSVHFLQPLIKFCACMVHLKTLSILNWFRQGSVLWFESCLRSWGFISSNFSSRPIIYFSSFSNMLACPIMISFISVFPTPGVFLSLGIELGCLGFSSSNSASPLISF